MPTAHPAPPLRVVVGLGANLGDREATLRGALAAIATLPDTALLGHSPIVETAPVGPPQGDYLNAAALIETRQGPLALLDLLLGIERSFGRVRKERWGPRTLDLDILWIDGLTVDDPRLVVPHPQLLERRFALGPLLEVAPDAVDPRTRQPLSEALSRLPL